MLIESAVVVGVDKTISQLGALALTPSSSSSSDVAAFHPSQCSTSSSPSDKRSSSSSSSGDSPPDPSSNEAMSRSLIDDIVESVIDDRSHQVTECCDRLRSGSIGSEDVSVREQAGGEACRLRSPSPLLEESAFQVSSLLDLFYDDQSKLSDESAHQDDSVNHHRKPDDRGKTESEPDCEIIEISGDIDHHHENWSELWDISLDQTAFACEPPASEIFSDIPAASNRSDNLVYFFEHVEFTPADLLPLYQPDVPLEFCFPRLNSPSPTVFTVNDVSDLEGLYYDDAAELSAAELSQTSDPERVISDEHDFDNTQDLALVLSDDDYRRLCMTSDEDNGEPISQSRLCLTNTSPEEQELPNSQRSHNSSRSHSPEPIRSRIRRKMSNQSNDGPSGAKRSRTLCSNEPSTVEMHQPDLFMHTRPSSYDDRFVDFSADQIWDQYCQCERSRLPNDNLQSRATALIKASCCTALHLLVIVWQFWIGFLASLASSLYHIIGSVHCPLYLQNWVLRIASHLRLLVELGRERFSRKRDRRGRERTTCRSQTGNRFGRGPNITEASQPGITIVH